MIAKISEGAGAVWRYLHANGPTTPAQLRKQLKMPSEIFYGALGWLAREDKVAFEGTGRRQKVGLK